MIYMQYMVILYHLIINMYDMFHHQGQILSYIKFPFPHYHVSFLSLKKVSRRHDTEVPGGGEVSGRWQTARQEEVWSVDTPGAKHDFLSCDRKSCLERLNRPGCRMSTCTHSVTTGNVTKYIYLTTVLKSRCELLFILLTDIFIRFF